MLSQAEWTMLDPPDGIDRVYDIEQADFRGRFGQDASTFDSAHAADKPGIPHEFQDLGKVIFWNLRTFRDRGGGQRLVLGLRKPYGGAQRILCGLREQNRTPYIKSKLVNAKRHHETGWPGHAPPAPTAQTIMQHRRVYVGTLKPLNRVLQLRYDRVQ